MPIIAKREWSRIGVISAVLVILLQLPYLLGYWTTPADSFYTGLLVNVEDANYITIIQRGSEGAWMHSLRFTSETDTPAFLYVFYLALGHLARVLHVDATTMWHVARTTFTLIVFLAAFGFIATFVGPPRERMVGYLFAIVGAGFDWSAFPWETLAPTSATPADLKMADAHLFSAALTFPHYLASILALMIVFWCAVRLVTEPLPRLKFWLLVVSGATANIAVGLVYPFFLILVFAVLALYILILTLRARRVLWREGGIVATILLPAVPLVLYYQSALASSELLRIWSAQSQTLSPNPLHYVLTFLPYLVLALLDLWRVGFGEAAQVNRRALLWAWVFAVAFLVYAPLGAQRRFLQGVQIPLAILAAFGLFEVVLPRVRRATWFHVMSSLPNYTADGLERLFVVLLVMLVGISSAYQWLSAAALTTFTQSYPLFRPRTEIEAMDWLGSVATAGDVVLSAYFTGSYLPLRSGTRVYLGHVYETIHFAEKERRVDQFFDVNTADRVRMEFLQANEIRYVFYGRAEQALGKFDPEAASYLERVFSNSSDGIYKVRLQ